MGSGIADRSSNRLENYLHLAGKAGNVVVDVVWSVVHCHFVTVFGFAYRASPENVPVSAYC
jgi:hypothetical protein